MKRRRLWAFSLLISLIFALLLAGCGSANNKQTAPDTSGGSSASGQEAPPDTSAKNNKYNKPPAMQIDPNKTYIAVVKTNKGDFTIQLFAKDAPKTVNNFVFLARDKFYDGIRFHRVIKDFMIQTGDPLGNGTGGPGYQFADELPPKIPYAPGVVAMANAGPNTNGSQFFIGTGDEVKSLNQTPNYTVFGKVTAGMDVVEKIASVPVGPSPMGENSVPKEAVYIKTVEIQEK
jgi:cyclophilin family peptidyl-prolyl cis-trans isomerase